MLGPGQVLGVSVAILRLTYATKCEALSWTLSPGGTVLDRTALVLYDKYRVQCLRTQGDSTGLLMDKYFGAGIIRLFVSPGK